MSKESKENKDEEKDFEDFSKDEEREEFEGFDEYDDFLDDDFDFEEDYEDFDFEDLEAYEQQERQAIIEEIKEIANDKVEKNKTFEQYVEENDEERLLTFLGPQVVTKEPEEIKKINENLREYLIENRKEILRENIIYMPDSIIKNIQDVPENGIVEIDFEEDIRQIVKIAKYELLKRFGMAFMAVEDNKVIIHIPLVKEMKQLIKDPQIMEKQKIVNEKLHVIIGICEVHGAIRINKVYQLMKEFYNETDKKKVARFLLMACGVLGIGRVKLDENTGKLLYIYTNWIDEEMANEIIKSNKQIKTYTKEEYLKYGKENYIMDTKGYRDLKEQFDSEIFDEDDLFELLNNLVIPYTIEARMGNNKPNEIMKTMERQLVDIIGEEGLIELGLNTKEIENALQEIVEALPKWIQN